MFTNFNKDNVGVIFLIGALIFVAAYFRLYVIETIKVENQKKRKKSLKRAKLWVCTKFVDEEIRVNFIDSLIRNDLTVYNLEPNTEGVEKFIGRLPVGSLILFLEQEKPFLFKNHENLQIHVFKMVQAGERRSLFSKKVLLRRNKNKQKLRKLAEELSWYIYAFCSKTQ